jgi:hypothetical protein
MTPLFTSFPLTIQPKPVSWLEVKLKIKSSGIQETVNFRNPEILSWILQDIDLVSWKIKQRIGLSDTVEVINEGISYDTINKEWLTIKK